MANPEPRQLTLVIHGTFAREMLWWRPGDDPSAPTFADRLEAGLSAHGLAGTVWQPAIEAGLQIDDFAWSGDNTHRARVVGGLELAVALSRTAKRLGATPEVPLEVNLVAHSHGGNVCLEALRQLAPEVRVRRLIFLGTPLIDRRRSLRVLRASLAIFVLAFMITAFFVLFIGLAGMVSGIEGIDALVDISLGALVVMVLLGSWTFVMVAGIADLFWQAISWPIDQVRRRKNQLYGPPAAQLASLLRDHPALLVTSHFDEADLLLQFGSRPRLLFDQMIRRRWPAALRALEFVFFRPFIDWMAFHLVEMILEHYAIGLPWHLCFVNDYRCADLDRGSSYPGTVFRRLDVTHCLEESLRRPSPGELRVADRGLPDDDPETIARFRGDRQMADLYVGVRQVGRTISEQVRFLHSRYYVSEAVIELIVSAIVDDEIDWDRWRRPNDG
ncbi:MAG: hypothetical protein H6710_11620 [Myxococcales bacterium]|nr:hypothetical protein [Myxococcales bacterium]MCB9700282.1 hypothetical protein [Myxococcales bacterium]